MGSVARLGFCVYWGGSSSTRIVSGKGGALRPIFIDCFGVCRGVEEDRNIWV
jgi:hypothetical protein